MTEMKIGVVGASGRMGGAVIRQVTEIDGCVVSAASERVRMPGRSQAVVI
jgi:4-hydroxy-tetrahydrodipicolinate reductase